MNDSPLSKPGSRRGSWADWLERRINLSEIFSLITHFGAIYTPIDTNQPIREVVKKAAAQPLPFYTTWPRVFGLLVVILFALEAITGLLLTFYYRPTMEAAFSSTRVIVRDLSFGWFIHQIHAWGAYVLIAVIVIRLLRLFWNGDYRAPREVVWGCALALTWTALLADFTGRLLPWDNDSYWTVSRGLEVIGSLPAIAPVFSYLIGSKVVDGDVLIRFYVLHVVFLPMLFLGFLYLTFASIRRVGLSPVPGGEAERTTTLRAHLYTTIILTVLAFGVLVSLSVLLPFPFLQSADPYSTPTGIAPPWYMLASYALLERVPGPTWLIGLGIIAITFVLLGFPFLMRGQLTIQNLRRMRIVGAGVLLIWAILSVIGASLERS